MGDDYTAMDAGEMLAALGDGYRMIETFSAVEGPLVAVFEPSR